MIGSTEAGLKRPTIQNDRFNISLVQQIRPHLEKFELNDALIKFIGDGWIVMIPNEEKVHNLCYLAIAMADSFREDINKLTGISRNKIPSLRLAICFGRDIPVNLPDGRKDWVGDSARRAMRASGFCFPNEILIDYSVKSHIMRDFFVEELDPKQRPPKFRPKRMEENFQLYILGELKTDEGTNSDIYKIIIRRKKLNQDLHSWNSGMASLPDYSSVLKMFNSFDFSEFSPDVITYNTLINKAPDYNEAKTWSETMVDMNIQPNLVTYNTLIKKAPDYDKAKFWVEKMSAEEIQADIFTYNTLIDKAPDYNVAKMWVDKIEEGGKQPNVVTYSMLINKAPDYNEAKMWVIRMETKSCQPNFITYNTLIKKAPDFNEAKMWVDRMETKGIQPDIVTYNTLFSKNFSEKSADDILDWYLAQKYHPETPLQVAIATYLKIGRIDQAFRLVLDYPHLKTARKVILEHPDAVLQYLKNVFDNNPLHPNASYALGTAFLELGNEKEAELYLKKALKLATASLRIAKINEWLLQIDRKNSNSD